MDTPQDEPVGYRKPPKHTQFKPGKSGNPKGRPKGSVNMSTLVDQALQQKVPVTENGKKRYLTKAQVAVCQQANKAAQGDAKALQTLCNIQQSLEPGQRSPREAIALPQSEITSEQCMEILRQWFVLQPPAAPTPRRPRTRIIPQKGEQL